jgi:hypothetical protein
MELIERTPVLCKHAFISLKSLNRRLFIVQNPLQIGLLIGLQKKGCFVRVRKDTPNRDSIRSETTRSQLATLVLSVNSPETQAARRLARVSGPFHLVPSQSISDDDYPAEQLRVADAILGRGLMKRYPTPLRGSLLERLVGSLRYAISTGPA